MSGPTWATKKVVKKALKEAGVHPTAAVLGAAVAGVGVSLIFHDHWGHAPDPDDMADLGACLADDDCSSFVDYDHDSFCDRKVALNQECDHTYKIHTA